MVYVAIIIVIIHSTVIIMVRIILQYDESMHGFSIGEAIYTIYS